MRQVPLEQVLQSRAQKEIARNLMPLRERDALERE